MTEIPAIDTGAVTTTVVDCATPHQAEVYLLAPLAVNTAIDQVANEKCAKGFVDYTGTAVQRRSFRGDVSDRLEPGSDREQSHPEYRHLLPAGREWRATDEVRALLIHPVVIDVGGDHIGQRT